MQIESTELVVTVPTVALELPTEDRPATTVEPEVQPTTVDSPESPPVSVTDLVVLPVGKKLAKRLASLGCSPERAIELARDHGSSPGHIAGWMKKLQLVPDEVAYLLQVRSDFDLSGVSFAELHRLWVWCSGDLSHFVSQREREEIGNEMFESFCEFANDAVGHCRYPLWLLNQRIEEQYEGQPDRLLEDLNVYGWDEVMGTDDGRVARAYRDLAELEIDWEAEGVDDDG